MSLSTFLMLLPLGVTTDILSPVKSLKTTVAQLEVKNKPKKNLIDTNIISSSFSIFSLMPVGCFGFKITTMITEAIQETIEYPDAIQNILGYEDAVQFYIGKQITVEA
jgi:hypothetical protein